MDLKGYLPESRSQPNTLTTSYQVLGTQRKNYPVWAFSLLVLFYLSLQLNIGSVGWRGHVPADSVIIERKQMLQKCSYIKSAPGPPPHFYARSQSDRYVLDTKPVWLKNAKVLTGARNGTEVIYGDVFLDKGLIKAVGYIPPQFLNDSDPKIEDVRGAWVTPGLVDLHSHIGVGSSPQLRGCGCFFIAWAVFILMASISVRFKL